ARAAFFEELTPRIQAVPGVQLVAYANQFPMRGGWGSSFRMNGGSDGVRDADFQAVSPEYFATLGIPLVRGRLIADEDRDRSLRASSAPSGRSTPISRSRTCGRSTKCCPPRRRSAGST